MHPLDILILVIGAIFIIIGIKRGLIIEVIRLIAMIAGCCIAFFYYREVAQAVPLRGLPLQQGIKSAIAFIVLYVVSVLVIIGIGWTIKKIIHLSLLGWLDRLLGACIGLLKTVLIAYVACCSIALLPPRRIQSDFKNSVVYQTYVHLPKSLTIKSLLKKRGQLRTIFNKNPSSAIDPVQKRIEKFRDVVDSAKQAQSSSTKD